MGEETGDWEFTESLKSSNNWPGFKTSSDQGEILSTNPSLWKKEEEDPAVKCEGKSTGYCLDCRDVK